MNKPHEDTRGPNYDWKPEVDHLRQVLEATRALLHKVDSSSERLRAENESLKEAARRLQANCERQLALMKEAFIASLADLVRANEIEINQLKAKLSFAVSELSELKAEIEQVSSCRYCNVTHVELCPKCDLIEARELLSKLAIAKEALTFIYQGGAKPFESKDLAQRMLAMSSKAGEALERLKDIKK